MSRLIVFLVMIGGCVWLLTSGTLTGWLVWLDVAFIATMVIGAALQVSRPGR
jgi:hypothetical protein